MAEPGWSYDTLALRTLSPALPGRFPEEIFGHNRLRGMTILVEGKQRDLIDACRRGERDAFRALFESYKDKVYSIALRFTGDEALAMDLAQDTFVKLFSSIRDFRGDSSFDT